MAQRADPFPATREEAGHTSPVPDEVLARLRARVNKYNENHDPKSGEFTSGRGGNSYGPKKLSPERQVAQDRKNAYFFKLTHTRVFQSLETDLPDALERAEDWYDNAIDRDEAPPNSTEMVRQLREYHGVRKASPDMADVHVNAPMGAVPPVKRKHKKPGKGPVVVGKARGRLPFALRVRTGRRSGS